MRCPRHGSRLLSLGLPHTLQRCGFCCIATISDSFHGHRLRHVAIPTGTPVFVFGGFRPADCFQSIWLPRADVTVSNLRLVEQLCSVQIQANPNISLKSGSEGFGLKASPPVNDLTTPKGARSVIKPAKLGVALPGLISPAPLAPECLFATVMRASGRRVNLPSPFGLFQKTAASLRRGNGLLVLTRLNSLIGDRRISPTCPFIPVNPEFILRRFSRQADLQCTFFQGTENSISPN